MSVVFSNNTPLALVNTDTFFKRACFSNEQASNVNIGAGQTTLLFNTFDDAQDIGVTYDGGSNTFTIPAGTWDLQFSGGFMQTDRAEMFLYDEDSVGIVEPHSNRVLSSSGNATHAFVYGQLHLVLSAPKTYSLRCQTQTGGSIYELQYSASGGNSGVCQVYRLIFIKYP